MILFAEKKKKKPIYGTFDTGSSDEAMIKR